MCSINQNLGWGGDQNRKNTSLIFSQRKETNYFVLETQIIVPFVSNKSLAQYPYWELDLREAKTTLHYLTLGSFTVLLIAPCCRLFHISPTGSNDQNIINMRKVNSFRGQFTKANYIIRIILAWNEQQKQKGLKQNSIELIIALYFIIRWRLIRLVISG